MKLIYFFIMVMSFSAFSQTTLHRGKVHMIALLDSADSKYLYDHLDIKAAKTDKGLTKTMGPQDKLVHISCTNKNEVYSCILMLKLYNLKEKNKEKAYLATSLYLATQIDQDKVSSWYKALNIPNRDFGGGHYFKEFLASDEAVYFNCRSHKNKKTCKLGIIL